MHIPDGFLSPPVWAALDAVSVPAVAVIARRAKENHHERNLPLLGVLGAFVFAAQMINFPVAAGTSAHLLGGALLACTIGPAAGVVVMTAVLAIQALVFQDGGLLALGANVFNLAIAGVFAGYLPYRLLPRPAGAFLGGMLSVLTGGLLALAELQLSGITIPTPVAAMSLGLFAVNAIAEGVITVAVLRGLQRMNPRWIHVPARRNRTALTIGAAAVALSAAGFLLASTAPDTLDTVAGRLGLGGRDFQLVSAPMADYAMAGIHVEWVAKAAAGVIGLVLVYATSVVIARTLMRRSS